VQGAICLDRVFKRMHKKCLKKEHMDTVSVVLRTHQNFRSIAVNDYYFIFLDKFEGNDYKANFAGHTVVLCNDILATGNVNIKGP